MAAHLRRAGVNFTWDMGTVKDLWDMKAILGGRKVKDLDVEILPGGEVAWRDRKQWSGTNLDRGWELHGGQEQEPPGPQGIERDLIWHLCPPVPANRWHFTRKLKLHLFAQAVGNTPKNVEEFIDGKVEEPGDMPAPQICPKAGVCATGCASLQLEGRADHPPTHDGTWQACGYRRFLDNYHAAPPEIREAAAEEICQEIDRERRSLQKRDDQGQDDYDSDRYEPYDEQEYEAQGENPPQKPGGKQQQQVMF